MNEEINVRKEGRDDKEPLVSDNHVPKTMYLTPRDADHSEEGAAKAIGRLWQSSKTTLHNAVIYRE
jgi:hypothetical protein